MCIYTWIFGNIWKTAKTCISGIFYSPVPPITLRTKPQPSHWPCLSLHPHPPAPIPHLSSVAPLQSLAFFCLDLRVFAFAQDDTANKLCVFPFLHVTPSHFSSLPPQRGLPDHPV